MTQRAPPIPPIRLRFGDLRAQGAEGDKRAEQFTKVLDQAAKAHQAPQPAAA